MRLILERQQSPTQSLSNLGDGNNIVDIHYVVVIDGDFTVNSGSGHDNVLIRGLVDPVPADDLFP